MAFCSGLIYTWAQTIFSYMINPKLAKPVVSHCRLGLCVISTFFFVSMIVFGPILGKHPDTNEPEDHTVGGRKGYKWTGHEPNYAEHVSSTKLTIIDCDF